MTMVQDKNIESLKKGKLSYFNLSKEEIENFEKILKEQIKKDKEEIEVIKAKINAEKTKIKNNI